LVRRLEMNKLSDFILVLGSRLAVRTDRAEPSRFMSVVIRHDLFRVGTLMWPNKSPEPTAVAAAVAIHAASRRWLSFFR
jgi:hypothetical protein